MKTNKILAIAWLTLSGLFALFIRKKADLVGGFEGLRDIGMGVFTWCEFALAAIALAISIMLLFPNSALGRLLTKHPTYTLLPYAVLNAALYLPVTLPIFSTGLPPQLRIVPPDLRWLPLCTIGLATFTAFFLRREDAKRKVVTIK